MTHAARILADSISPDGVRLTTLEVTLPRIVLAEFNTHRIIRSSEDVDNCNDFGSVFSRNSASSRAIPVEKMIRMVQENPYVPGTWGQNQKGMQAGEDLTGQDAEQARLEWLLARDHAVTRAKALLELGVHKQLTNRLLEPFMWHTLIASATEWSNWDHLRRDEKAHPEIKRAADLMFEAREASTPERLDYGDWHLPLIGPEDYDLAFESGLVQKADDSDKLTHAIMVPVSVGRCARVSYLTHDGKRDFDADIRLHDDLLANGHMSPFEHVARPATSDDVVEPGAMISGVVAALRYTPADLWFGNFRGWVQYRKTIPYEHDIKSVPR
jgi:hypothetical protein